MLIECPKTRDPPRLCSISQMRQRTNNLRSGERRVVGSETILEGARGEGWIVMLAIACVFKKVIRDDCPALGRRYKM